MIFFFSRNLKGTCTVKSGSALVGVITQLLSGDWRDANTEAILHPACFSGRFLLREKKVGQIRKLVKPWTGVLQAVLFLPTSPGIRDLNIKKKV